MPQIPREPSFENPESLYNSDRGILYDKVSGISRDNIEIFTPKNREQLKSLILAANSEKQQFSVASCGRNWGYGGLLPTQSNNKVINLYQMNQILSFDEATGVLHIEAGVTQGQLEKYLDDNDYNFYVPNTGAGPEGSIIGNALERGFGISPVEDHVESLLAVNGFYPDGSDFAPALDEVDPKLSSCFPHGIGPCLSKLVPQSPWVIVTDAKIQLLQRRSDQILFTASFSENDWNQVVHFLQQIGLRKDIPAGSFKIINQRQIELSSASPQLSSSSSSSSPSSSPWLQRLTRNQEWVLMFFLRCESRLANTLKKEIQRILLNCQLHSISWTKNKIQLFRRILSFLPFQSSAAINSALSNLYEFYKLGDGRTSWVGHKFRSNDEGLIWLSPLCPIDLERVSRLRNLTKTWSNNDILKVKTWTWTVLNPRTMALVMPLVFDIKLPQEAVWTEYHNKLEALRKEGFVPYRYPIESMNYLKTKVAPQYFSKINLVNKALDPLQLLNAGRYS